MKQSILEVIKESIEGLRNADLVPKGILGTSEMFKMLKEGLNDILDEQKGKKKLKTYVKKNKSNPNANERTANQHNISELNTAIIQHAQTWE